MEASDYISIITLMVMGGIAISTVVWKSGTSGGQLRQKVKGLCERVTDLFTRVGKVEKDHKEDLGRIYDSIEAMRTESAKALKDMGEATRKGHDRIRGTMTMQGKALTVLLASCHRCDPEVVKAVLDTPNLFRIDSQGLKPDERGPGEL